MAVSTGAIPVLATASKVTASHAKPEVGTQITFSTMSKRFYCNLLCACLIEGESVLAWLELKFPFRNRLLEIG